MTSDLKCVSLELQFCTVWPISARIPVGATLTECIFGTVVSGQIQKQCKRHVSTRGSLMIVSFSCYYTFSFTFDLQNAFIISNTRIAKLHYVWALYFSRYFCLKTQQMLWNLEYILKISYTVVFADVNSYDNVMQSISNEFISIFVWSKQSFPSL